MIVVRKDSPLVIGTCQDENYISSDIPAILSFTRNFYLLNDLEFVLLSKNDVKFFDKNLKESFKKDYYNENECIYEDYNFYLDFDTMNSTIELIDKTIEVRDKILKILKD